METNRGLLGYIWMFPLVFSKPVHPPRPPPYIPLPVITTVYYYYLPMRWFFLKRHHHIKSWVLCSSDRRKNTETKKKDKLSEIISNHLGLLLYIVYILARFGLGAEIALKTQGVNRIWANSLMQTESSQFPLSIILSLAYRLFIMKCRYLQFYAIPSNTVLFFYID